MKNGSVVFKVVHRIWPQDVPVRQERCTFEVITVKQRYFQGTGKLCVKTFVVIQLKIIKFIFFFLQSIMPLYQSMTTLCAPGHALMLL